MPGVAEWQSTRPHCVSTANCRRRMVVQGACVRCLHHRLIVSFTFRYMIAVVDTSGARFYARNWGATEASEGTDCTSNISKSLTPDDATMFSLLIN